MRTNSRNVPRLRLARIAAAFLLLVPAFPCIGEEREPGDKMNAVLQNMGKASGNFKSLAADITMKKWDAMVGEFTDPENGEFYYKRANDGSALLRIQITDPAKKITTIRDGEVLVYQPAMKTAMKYTLGKNRDKVEYIALGFGKSPEDLKKAYNVSYGGTETIDGSSCSILVLKPKASSIFSSITVWIKDATGISTRMKMVEKFDDYILMDFSNEKLNEKIDDSIFKEKIPKDVDVTRLSSD